jgi:hypothetical protein
MAGRPSGPHVNMLYGHFVSTTPGFVVSRDQWAVHPLAFERPEQGRRDEPVRCATCGKTFTVRVLSLDRTLRLRRTLRASAVTGLVLAVLGAALAAAIAPALTLIAIIGFVTAFTAVMRLRLEIGVTARHPGITRLRGHRLLPAPDESSA